jgi:hypothetical protein
MLYTSVMSRAKKERPLYQRIIIDIAGFGLIIVSPVLSPIPGPGGIPIFLAGVGLLALNHEWAENLLKDFENKRREFTDKYLMASKRVSWSIDVIALLVISFGAFLSATQHKFIFKAAGFALISLSLVVIISNQKRLERIIKLVKKH